MGKFKFKKRHTNLYVYYKPYLSIYLKITYPMRDFIKKLSPKLKVLYIQEEIRRRYLWFIFILKRVSVI